MKNFKSGVRVKKKRWRMKYYDDCFSGSDALAWIHDFLKCNPNFGQNVSRTQAKLLCQKLLQRNVFEDVVGQFKSRKPEFEETHLYGFVMRESNRNLDIPPPGIPGEFACLVFEEGGNLNFFLVEGGEFA